MACEAAGIVAPPRVELHSFAMLSAASPALPARDLQSALASHDTAARLRPKSTTRTWPSALRRFIVGS